MSHLFCLAPRLLRPPHIRQVTWFGERADWSHNGKRILFLSKTFGDAMELDLTTMRIRNRTAHYPHHGYTRALYLANGDILLSGPEAFDPRKTREARVQCRLYVLDQSGTNPVVSDDGGLIAFQLAKSREAAGVGHGIFVMDLAQAPVTRR